MDETVCEEVGIMVSKDVKPRQECTTERIRQDKVLRFTCRSVSHRLACHPATCPALVRPRLCWAVWSARYRMEVYYLETTKISTDRQKCYL